MDRTEQSWCELIIDYAFDQMPSDDRLSFERHLAACESCRAELAELREAWNGLSLSADEADPPTHLKGLVMSSIFGDSQKRQFLNAFSSAGRKSIWFYLTSAAVILTVIIGTVWNIRLTEERRSEIATLPVETAHIEKLVSLKAQTEDADQAHGVACVLKKGRSSQLVVYLFGANRNQGDDAYQVWLLRDGARLSAGTFQVGEEGIGVLTYAMDRSRPFDAIGITLEPDGKGERPRGPKVFGSTERIEWN